MSWNVNGLRAVVKKDFVAQIDALAPDVLGLQETKAQDDQVREALFGFGTYEVHSSSAIKKGYSGTAILTKKTCPFKRELAWRTSTKRDGFCAPSLRTCISSPSTHPIPAQV